MTSRRAGTRRAKTSGTRPATCAAATTSGTAGARHQQQHRDEREDDRTGVPVLELELDPHQDGAQQAEPQREPARRGEGERPPQAAGGGGESAGGDRLREQLPALGV